MDVDREQLQKLREQIGRKAHLTSIDVYKRQRQKLYHLSVNNITEYKKAQRQDVYKRQVEPNTSRFNPLCFAASSIRFLS